MYTVSRLSVINLGIITTFDVYFGIITTSDVYFGIVSSIIGDESYCWVDADGLIVFLISHPIVVSKINHDIISIIPILLFY